MTASTPNFTRCMGAFIMAASMSSSSIAQIIPVNVPPVKLFEELDFARPGLDAVRKAVSTNDTSAAKAALLAYFRSRPDCALPPTPRKDYDTHIADRILEGVFIWGDTTCTYGPKVSDIDWYRVPKGVYWPLFDHQLGRHTFSATLSSAYRHTGDDRYVAHLVAMLRDFVRKCPVEDGRRMPRINNADCLAHSQLGVEGLETKGAPALQWTQMAAMRGLQRWPLLFKYCLGSPAVTADDFFVILTSLIEQQRYIVDAMEVCKFGNHGPRTTSVVLEISAFFPELKDHPSWVRRAEADMLRRYNWHNADERGFIYPDGATVEISPEVGVGDYGTLLQAMKWLRTCGHEPNPQLLTVQEKMAEYFAGITWPGTLTTNRKRKRKGPGFKHRPDLDYVSSGGATGSTPHYTSYPAQSSAPCFAGTYFMRSDWTPEAIALRVRFGPIQYKYSMFGLGDVGDVGVWGHGMHLIPHIYHHPRTGDFVTYGDRSFRGNGLSENTVTIDGIGQSKANRIRRTAEPLSNPWHTNPVFDFVRGNYTFDKKKVEATHTRAILFMRPDYFLIIDSIDSKGDSHTHRMKYQLHQDLTVDAAGTRVIGRHQGSARLLVQPTRSDLALEVVKGRIEPFREGWHLLSAKGDGVPAPALLYTWSEPGPSYVETVLLPMAPDAAREVQVTRKVIDNKVIIRVTRGEDEDTITINHSSGDIGLVRRRAGALAAAGVIGTAPLLSEGLSIEHDSATATYLIRAEDGSYQTVSNGTAKVAVHGNIISE